MGGLCLASTCIGLFEHKSYVMSISPNTIPMLSLSTISIRRALSHEDPHLSLLFIHFLLQLLSDFCFWFRFHEIFLPGMTEINFIHNTVLRCASFSLSGHETIKFLFHLQNCGIAFIQHFSGPAFSCC